MSLNTERQRRRDDTRLTKSRNTRSEQLLMMPTDHYPTENGCWESS